MKTFRSSTVHMKINQISYLIFQTMNHHSVLWHKITLKFPSSKIICYGQKMPIKVQIFRVFSVLMNLHPIPHAVVETARSESNQILQHC